MSESKIAQPEIGEIEPRAKMLFINLSPGAKPHIQMAQSMFGKGTEFADEFQEMACLTIAAPSVKQEPDTAKREKQSTLPLPDYVTDFTGIVITGSPFAAYPREEDGKLFIASWKKDLVDFLKAADRGGVPVLGICYGAQILAEALGGQAIELKNARGTKVLETGFARIRKVGDGYRDLLIGSLPEEFVAPENHADGIARLPEGAVLLAENEFGVQGFRVRKCWGFQFHPERPPKEAIKKMESKKSQLEEIGINPQGILDLEKDYDPGIKKIFTNFLDLAWQGKQ